MTNGIDRYVSDTATNGGGEGSATGNTLGWQDPSTSGMVGVLKKLILFNNTGANGTWMADIDSATIATALGAVADLAYTVGANETVTLTEEDFGTVYMINGLVYQASNAATGNGWKVIVECVPYL